MAQSPGWHSKISNVIWRMERDAAASGLKAAAVVYQKMVIKELAEGYKSGKYSKGIVAKGVVRGRATPWRCWVGSPSKVALLWEVGHVNMVTKEYERVEVFRPFLEQSRNELARVFSDRYIEKLAEVAHKKLLPALEAPE